MSKNNLKKMYVFSSEETKEIIDKYVKQEAEKRNCSLSTIVEELLLDAIYENIPESRTEIMEIFEKRYLFSYNRAVRGSEYNAENS